MKSLSFMLPVVLMSLSTVAFAQSAAPTDAQKLFDTRTSPDGKTVEFDFLDVAGSTDYGHMHHAVFIIIDASHHTEDWTYMMPGDKPLRAHMDLKRTE